MTSKVMEGHIRLLYITFIYQRIFIKIIFNTQIDLYFYGQLLSLFALVVDCFSVLLFFKVLFYQGPILFLFFLPISNLRIFRMTLSVRKSSYYFSCRMQYLTEIRNWFSYKLILMIGISGQSMYIVKSNQFIKILLIILL